MAEKKIPRNLKQRKRNARRLALRPPEERYRHELLDPEERLILRERVLRLSK